MKKLFWILAIVTIACTQEDPKPTQITLDYYTEGYQVPGLEFKPQTRVEYEYNPTGTVARYTFKALDPTTNVVEEQRHFDFSYTDGRTSKLEGFLANTTSPYVTYNYTYLDDGRISKITEQNIGAGVNSEANFTYWNSDSITVAYTYSNGGSFEYHFRTVGSNIVGDKTTRGSQLCSNGYYTYDNHINPLNKLGYVDYTLASFSTNNKLSEEVSYVACAFPTLVPESFAYEYNEQGYPTKMTTTYKSGGSTPMISVREYFYKAR